MKGTRWIKSKRASFCSTNERARKNCAYYSTNRKVGMIRSAEWNQIAVLVTYSCISDRTRHFYLVNEITRWEIELFFRIQTRKCEASVERGEYIITHMPWHNNASHAIGGWIVGRDSMRVHKYKFNGKTAKTLILRFLGRQFAPIATRANVLREQTFRRKRKVDWVFKI